MAAKKKGRSRKGAKSRKGRAKTKTAKRVKPIPDGYTTVTPAFQVAGCAKAIEFLEKAFGAKVKDRYDAPDGSVAHAELRIGNSVLMCGEAQEKPLNLGAMLYVKNCDVVYQKAIDLGAVVSRPIQSQFYGDRSGTVRDAWGNEWTLATHVEDVSKKEMHKRMEKMMSGG